MFPLAWPVSAASEQLRQALDANPEARYSKEELSIAQAFEDLPTTCGAGSVRARRRENRRRMATTKRTIEVELYDERLGRARAGPQRRPAVVDDGGVAGRPRGAAIGRAGSFPVTTCSINLGRTHPATQRRMRLVLI